MQDFTPRIEEYLTKLKNTIDRLDRTEINNFINLLLKARDEDRTIFIMGNGGSAATASHYCCDFNKGASYGCDKRFKFICLNDNTATMMAYANDISYTDAKAIEYANENGGTTIGLTGYQGGKLKQICTHSVNMRVDDMQISEDLHMMMDHLSMRVITGKTY